MEEGLLIHNSVFEDNRGTFAPLPLKFGEGKLSVLRKNWVQSNISVNPKKFTFRGLHFQVGEFAQSKLVKVITGEIIDFIVDIRPNSPNYLKTYEFVVKPNNELFVPKGFAHGFSVLSNKAEVFYKCDEFYNKANEAGFMYNDPDLNIDWQIPLEKQIISEKDLVLSSFKDHTSNFSY